MASIAEAVIPEQADLSLIQRALGTRRVLRFLYQGYGKTEAEPREVEPRGLLYYLGRWHLIAWCLLRGGIRDFRTDRMRGLEILAQGFTPTEEFDPAAYVRAHMPAPNLPVRVRFETEALDRARREWWMGLLEERPEADGGELTLRTPDLETIASWLLSFGASATVLDPPLLRRMLAERAEAAAAHHRRAP
jgi:predicted DNA-binding transcriptional regulator YafY